MAPKFLRVTNWDRYQHYKNRTPPWIKLYNSLLDDYAFCSLPDAAKAHFLCILLAASRQDNRIPIDAEWLGRFMSATEPINLELLTRVGLLAPCTRSASTMLAACKQSATPERETEREGERETTTSSNPPPADLDALARVKPRNGKKPDPELVKTFGWFYEDYPRHEGKQAALKAWVKLAPDKAVRIAIADDLDRRINSESWLPNDPERCKFIPLPASYLNGRRWEDA